MSGAVNTTADDMAADEMAALAALKKRFVVMVAADMACVIAAAVSMVLYFSVHLGWGLVGFVLSLLAGFAVQVWFVSAMRGAKRG